MGPGESRPRRWILVVDDDSTVRNLFVEVLEKAGYAAVGAEDGFVAEELIRDLFPDMVLLDLRMPRGSGWNLLNHVRQNPRWHGIPILVVSGFLGEGDPVTAGDLNIVGELPKPVNVYSLLAKVRGVLEA